MRSSASSAPSYPVSSWVTVAAALAAGRVPRERVALRVSQAGQLIDGGPVGGPFSVIARTKQTACRFPGPPLLQPHAGAPNLVAGHHQRLGIGLRGDVRPARAAAVAVERATLCSSAARWSPRRSPIARDVNAPRVRSDQPRAPRRPQGASQAGRSAERDRPRTSGTRACRGRPPHDPADRPDSQVGLTRNRGRGRRSSDSGSRAAVSRATNHASAARADWDSPGLYLAQVYPNRPRRSRSSHSLSGAPSRRDSTLWVKSCCLSSHPISKADRPSVPASVPLAG